MRKFVVLLGSVVVIALLLGVASCGGSSATTTAAPAATAAPATETTTGNPDTTTVPDVGGPKTIGLSLPQDTNPLYISMKKGIEARAAELGWKVVSVSSNENIAAQISGIEDLIAQKVDGILVSPIDSSAVNSAYDAAAKAGIPIISIARNSTSPNQVAWLPVDELQIGKDIGKWIADKLGGKGKVAMISGPPGTATFLNFSKGVEESLAAAPGIQVVFKKEGSLDRERGLKEAEDILVAHPDVNAIYAANDDLALGASQAVATAGKTGKVLVTGMNGTPPAIEALKAGQIDLTVDLNAVKWGAFGIDKMAEYFKGNNVSGTIIFQHALVDKSNVK